MRPDTDQLEAEINEHLRSVKLPTMPEMRRALPLMEFDEIDEHGNTISSGEPRKRHGYLTVYELTMDWDDILPDPRAVVPSTGWFELGKLFERFKALKTPRERELEEKLYQFYCQQVEEPTLHDLWNAYEGKVTAANYEKEMSVHRKEFRFRRGLDRLIGLT